jgi:hypothetical protein
MTDNLVTVVDWEIDSVLGHYPNMAAAEKALKHTLAIT